MLHSWPVTGRAVQTGAVRPQNSAAGRPKPVHSGQAKGTVAKNPLSQRGLLPETPGRRNSERAGTTAVNTGPWERALPTIAIVALCNPSIYKPLSASEPIFFELLSAAGGGAGAHALFFDDGTSEITAFFKPKNDRLGPPAINLPRKLDEPVVVARRTIRMAKVPVVADVIRRVAPLEGDDSLTWARRIIMVAEEKGCFS